MVPLRPPDFPAQIPKGIRRSFGPSAFTLIELLSSIAIIAVLVTCAIPYIGDYIGWAKLTSNNRTLTQLNEWINEYRTTGGMSAAHSLQGSNTPAKIQAVLAAMKTGFTVGGEKRVFLNPGLTIPSGQLSAVGQGGHFAFCGYSGATGSGSGATAGVNLNSGLVGYWTFDEGTGTMAHDVSGKGNNGTLSGGAAIPTWATGKVGGALNFTGTWGGGVTRGVGSSSVLDIAGDVTLCAWINPPVIPSPWPNIGTIIRCGIGADTRYGIYLDYTGKIAFAWYDTINRVTSSTSVISTNTWTHVAAVRSGTTLSFYVNGSFVNSTAVAAPLVTAGSLGIGRSGSTSQCFLGLIDDLRVYNRALSAAEVQQLYQDGQ